MAQQTFTAYSVATAAQLNTEFAQVPFRYQVGTATFSSSVTITFVASRFTQPPMVVTQSKSIGSAVAYEFTSVPTAASFNIERSVAGSWASHYVAIQSLTGSGAGP